jgi:hypothetical protein
MAGYRIPGALCGTRADPIDGGTLCRSNSPLPGLIGTVSPVTGLDLIDRLAIVIRRAIVLLPGQAGQKLGLLLSADALAAIGAALLAWAASHAFGVGEAFDLIMLGTGLVFLGREALDAVDHLAQFAAKVISARTDSDLELAAFHLSRAVSIIGVDSVIALLTHGAAKAWRGRYRPATVGDPAMPAGEAFTTKFGDIRYSTAGTANDRALALHHEKVHSFLSPKLMRFRDFRADLGMAGYNKSSLLRYLEEALAESYAQLRVNGIKGLPTGIRFPIANGYVTLQATLSEATIAAMATITVAGVVYAVSLEINER